MQLYNASDSSIGAAFPAFRVNLSGNESYKLSIKYKASAGASSGLYVRIYEYDAALPSNKLAISHNATNALVQEDSRKPANWIENAAISTTWTTSDFTYTPTSTAVWTSIVILNWTGLGTNKLYIRDPIYQLQTVFNSTNDGAGSGLDADTLDGLSPSVSASNSTIVQRHSSGYIYANYFNTTPNDVTSGISRLVCETNNDGFMRHATQAGVRTFIGAGSGNGLDADTLDGTHLSGIVERIWSSTSSSRNLQIKTDSSSNGAGILLLSSGGNFQAQLYGDAGAQGFLNSAWGSWELRKILNGQLELRVSGSNYTVWHSGNDGSASGLDADTVDGIHASSFLRSDASDTATGTLTVRDIKLSAGYHLQRSDHHSGHLEGSYNNVAPNTSKTNPIYSIGSSYNPNDATLSNFYGIGYSHTNASFLSFTGASGWGMYVAADGDARIFLSASNGVISSTGHHYVGSNVVWNAGNDGSGSGLDADTVDGAQASVLLGTHQTNNLNIINKGYYTTATSGQNQNSGSISYGWGYQINGAWSHPYPDIIFGYHTGMRFGGHTSYGGCRFYSDHPSRTSTILFSVGNGNTDVAVTNNLTAGGNVTAYSSDRRLKENFKNLENPLEKISKLNGCTFDWKEKVKELGFVADFEKDDVGLIAQEVQAVCPQAVAPAPFDHEVDIHAENPEDRVYKSKSGENYLTVKYEKLVPLLVESVKELITKLNTLQERLDHLEGKE